MRRSITSFVFLLVVLAVVGIPAPVTAQAADLVSVESLLLGSALFDGQTITLEGELIGDYGFRDDGWMWTQLNDDSYARRPLVDGGPRTGGNIGVGVRMPIEAAMELDPPGGYRLRGPLVRLTGIWKHHDPDRQGESYLEVTSVDVVSPGGRLDEGPDWLVFFAGTGLIAVAGLLWVRRPREA